MSGTDVAYGATQMRETVVMMPSKLRYLPTALLRDVRYSHSVWCSQVPTEYKGEGQVSGEGQG
eukprot:106069-Rhodomonas_salina.2